jgi:hypothetical protein
MSSRKPTVDDLDDVDDEDGVTEEEIVQETDLTLIVKTVEEILNEGVPPDEPPSEIEPYEEEE